MASPMMELLDQPTPTQRLEARIESLEQEVGRLAGLVERLLEAQAQPTKEVSTGVKTSDVPFEAPKTTHNAITKWEDVPRWPELVHSSEIRAAHQIAIKKLAWKSVVDKLAEGKQIHDRVKYAGRAAENLATKYLYDDRESLLNRIRRNGIKVDEAPESPPVSPVSSSKPAAARSQVADPADDWASWGNEI